MLWLQFGFARPAKHASNLSFTDMQCNSLTLSWTNGDGNARLIVAKEGSAPDYVPMDHKVYSGDSRFGKSAKYGSNLDNFVVYNSNATNFVRIDSLKQGKTYYFTIYEHDNAGSLTEYYTSGAPTISEITYFIDPGLSITYFDSCQDHNLYKFTNTSISNIPGVTYKLSFGDLDTISFTGPVMHSYKISGFLQAKVLAYTSIKGCNNQVKNLARVYQKKMAFVDFAQGHDTVQCFQGHQFNIKTGNYVNPLSGAYGYRWFTDEDTSPFTFFRKTFKTSGRRKVSLEITTYIVKGATIHSTGCKDTQSFFVTVHPNALKNLVVNSSLQRIDTNSFVFSNIDTDLVSQAWYFGDGDSSHLQKDTHTYADTGKYNVIFKGYDNKGCYHEKTLLVKVLPYNPASIGSLQVNARLSLYPNPSNGKMMLKSMSGENIWQIYIYDMMGSRIKEIILPEGKTMFEINLEDLSAGHYMLMTWTGNSVDSQLIQLAR